jgi:hypothetical protein
MRRSTYSVRTVSVIGAVLVFAGVTLVGVSAVAAARRPTLTFAPNGAIGTDEAVLVSASHFKSRVVGGLAECSVTPGEPTIKDVTTGRAEPVGCAPFEKIKTTATGGLPITGYGITTGAIGSPDAGTDSAGTDAATDALDYPCPPTAGQLAAGGACALVYTTVKGQSARAPIDFNFESTTTTLVTIPPGCTPASASGTSGSATVTVTPATCLVNDLIVEVTGTGLHPATLGSLLECNTDPAQPTVFLSLSGDAVPVGCSNLVSDLTTTSAGGTVATKFTIVTGTVGPPGTGTDSSGGDAATDAANYPCPPTAAQVASGVTCALEWGDLAGDKVTVPLAFAS